MSRREGGYDPSRRKEWKERQSDRERDRERDRQQRQLESRSRDREFADKYHERFPG